MLHRPWVAPLVFAFWCVTAGWLAGTKILPSFGAGEAPNGVAFLAGTDGLPPVGWSVHWNGSDWSSEMPHPSRFTAVAPSLYNSIQSDASPKSSTTVDVFVD